MTADASNTPSEVDIKSLLARVTARATLSEPETYAAIDAMTGGGATSAQMAAFLVALKMRGETVAEITGAARLLRDKMTRVAVPAGAVDIVGTGGDGHATYNVSTCAALVAAGAGLKVAKHGNRSVSSLSGSSDVLAALGVTLDGPANPDRIARCIADAGVGFLWAPLYHPAMKAWAPVRAELGVRTLFNLLGPLCNPAGVTRQVIGVYSKDLVEPIAEVLRNLGAVHAWVVHGHDGLDELTTTGPTTIAEVHKGDIMVFELNPADAGLKRATLFDLKGGNAEVNARALKDVLLGVKGAYRDIVVLNAAAALIVGGRAADIASGALLAQHSIDSGAAAAALDRLIKVSSLA
jgi:anthranilate phosphoribosyltransferase